MIGRFTTVTTIKYNCEWVEFFKKIFKLSLFNFFIESDQNKVIFEPDLKLDTREQYIERIQLFRSLTEYQEQLALWEPPESLRVIQSVDKGQNTEIAGKLNLVKS